MKEIVSISLGGSHRDHETTTQILGQDVRIRRIGTDGDMQRARELFLELDGKVDAFGLGGCELGINFADRYYRLRAIAPLVEGLQTPVVDGSGVRAVVERSIAGFLLEHLPEALGQKRVLFCVAAARYDLVLGFQQAGFKLRFGDPGFVLGLADRVGQFLAGSFGWTDIHSFGCTGSFFLAVSDGKQSVRKQTQVRVMV